MSAIEDDEKIETTERLQEILDNLVVGSSLKTARKLSWRIWTAELRAVDTDEVTRGWMISASHHHAARPQWIKRGSTRAAVYETAGGVVAEALVRASPLLS